MVQKKLEIGEEASAKPKHEDNADATKDTKMARIDLMEVVSHRKRSVLC